MSLGDIKALTFDTGGTILDWHSGFREALAAAGARTSRTGPRRTGTRWPTSCGAGRSSGC